MLDPVIQQFQKVGWPALAASATRPLTGDKYHGLAIEYKDGAFQISARQYDGFSGLASPLLRSRTVRSLDQIARAAGLLLEPDFGPDGTVQVIPTDATQVMLEFRGHKLSPLEMRVKPGDLFAISVIKEQETKGTKMQTATAMPYTLLKVVEPVKEGKCKCLILSHWASPFGRDTRRVGVRAMKLATIAAPLRIQLVDRTGKPQPRGSLKITASDLDFSARATASDGFEWRDGFYRSTRPYLNLACISIGIEGDPPQQFPLAVLSEETITLTFEIKPADELRAEFRRECSDLRARIADLSTAQAAMLTRMNLLLDQAKNREALAWAETGRENVATIEKPLADELKHLQSQSGVNDAAAKNLLEVCALQLVVVQNTQSKLASHIASLKDAIGKAADPARLEKEFRSQELADRIKEHLAHGDVPEALAAYDKLIELHPSEASYKDEREKLRAEWTPKNEAHRAARDSIRSLGLAKTAEDFAAAAIAIKKAVPVLKKEKDRLGLRKLHNTFEPATAAIHELVLAADRTPRTAETAQANAKLEETVTDLQQCEVLVRTALKEVSTSEKK